MALPKLISYATPCKLACHLIPWKWIKKSWIQYQWPFPNIFEESSLQLWAIDWWNAPAPSQLLCCLNQVTKTMLVPAARPVPLLQCSVWSMVLCSALSGPTINISQTERFFVCIKQDAMWLPGPRHWTLALAIADTTQWDNCWSSHLPIFCLWSIINFHQCFKLLTC